MDYEYATEEFVNELNYYCGRRRRTVSETERRELWPAELCQQMKDQKARISQSISPRRPETAAANNGCSSHVEADGSGSKGGKRKIGDWLHGGGQHERRFASDEQDMETGESAVAETEYRRRTGSHGLRDLLRMRPRCNSHGERGCDADCSAGRGGNGSTLSPGGAVSGTVSSSTSSSASSSASKFRLFLGAFRHRAHSDSVSATRSPLHGQCHLYNTIQDAGWLGSRVVSVLDSGAKGPGSNRSRDAVR